MAQPQNNPTADPEPDSPALSIDMDMRHKPWSDLTDMVRAQAHYVWRYLSLPTAEISIVLADDDFVADLNRRYRGKTGATNVLSFPAQDFAAPAGSDDIQKLTAPRLLGDIVLAHETLAREAEMQGKEIAHHAAHLLTHGLLHLIGHDHVERAAAEKMERLETTILTGQGLPAPYALQEKATDR